MQPLIGGLWLLPGIPHSDVGGLARSHKEVAVHDILGMMGSPPGGPGHGMEGQDVRHYMAQQLELQTSRLRAWRWYLPNSCSPVPVPYLHCVITLAGQDRSLEGKWLRIEIAS